MKLKQQQKQNKIPVITIDGPSGSGKGTISKLLAQKLGWHLLDSGALYRVLALAALQQNIDIDDIKALYDLALDLPVEFVGSKSDSSAILLAGKDITLDIRSEACSKAASKVAAIPEVREALLARQRQFEQSPGLVADGRDMGTVVFPDAECKIFLTASPEERAKRRCQQLQDQGRSVSLRAVLQDIIARDARDSDRKVSPLKPAKDAITVDTTALAIKEVMQKIVEIYRSSTAS